MSNVSVAGADVGDAETAKTGLRQLLKRGGGLEPDSVLACPALVSIGTQYHPYGDASEAAVVIAGVLQAAIFDMPERLALEALFGLTSDTKGEGVGRRRAAAAELLDLKPESFRVRREPQLLDRVAFRLLAECGKLRGSHLSQKQGQQLNTPREPTRAALHATLPDGSTESFEVDSLGTRFVLGRRATCDIAIDDSEISGMHAEFETLSGHVVVADEGISTNGTFVNGLRLTGRRILRDGDSLRLGKTRVVFTQQNSRAAADTMPDPGSESVSAERMSRAIVRLARSISHANVSPVRWDSLLPDLTHDPGPSSGKHEGMSPDRNSPPPDPQIVLGRYDIERFLGSGGFGSVYSARDMALDRQVALKVVPSSGVAASRGWMVAGRLAHPNIVKIYEVAEKDDVAYIAMEQVSDGTLEDRITRDGLTPHDTLQILSDIASALDVLHDQGFVHRDLKPSNILLDRDGVPHLADFGAVASEDFLAQTEHFVGTLLYAAPEQLRGESVTRTADNFALAVILYECLAGSLPWGRYHKAEQLLMERLSQVTPGLDQFGEAMAEVLTRSLDHRPERRFARASELMTSARNAIAETSAFECQKPIFGQRSTADDRFLNTPRVGGR